MQQLIPKTKKATTFLELIDTPVSFTADKLLKANAGATALEDSTNTDTEIADAVTKKHSQNTDTDLDATFEATFVKKADTVNVLSDITSPGANIEDAVTKKHAQNTDTKIQDAAGVTKVDVEESAAEKIIRMDVNGVEAFKLNTNGILDLVKQSAIHVYRTTPQAIATATLTKIQLDTESFDIQNEFDPTTNYRFTATKAGKYAVFARVAYTAAGFDKIWYAAIYKNGTVISYNSVHSSLSRDVSIEIAEFVSLAVNDYLELWCYHEEGVNVDLLVQPWYTHMGIVKSL